MHIARFCVGRHGATAATDRNIGTVAAFLFMRAQKSLEAFSDSLSPCFFATINVSRRLPWRTSKARARVKRAVRTDRVGVTAMNLARTHVDAVGRREPALPCLVAE